ncbi:hypothetical protein SB394_12080 [Burkholderia sp. BCCIQ04A]|uniref:Uncharacterized protein n=1 Tax=Burkholderia anthinoferrum TaxID=3090833 RepID=A0ABU5WYU9_9BURK|nr:hypothetical protein [Burkholderia anthinoferrum]MEB2504652.1 hypothetical protein [Burkholderia anthinoferrum]MEB2530320.1 hypothetical protein [Burkholderia anthinoferrum]MEB2561693.1 hypothetical protein [Burkholderia anthinoferrum]MEB2583930.1 hypothetical protein [Burkholderia anthinoferrum]MEB2634465.1 hypothetical protein [Burkholderia anthinoferrum]
MMKTYARVDNGVVMEIIEPLLDDAGNEVPIEDRFTPEIVSEMIDVTGLSPMPECWWTYSDGVFSAP